jgi:transposase
VPALPSCILPTPVGPVRRPAPSTPRHPPAGLSPPRIPDRVIFDKLIQVLVVGCGYRRIDDTTCSATTLRRRRDEWIALGLGERLHLLSLSAYDRMLGLALDTLAVDGCIAKAPAAARPPAAARWTAASRA